MQSASLNQPRPVFDSQDIDRGIREIAQGLLSRHPDPSGLGLVGIHTGGDLLLRRLEAAMSQASGASLNLDKGLVDIAFYRDDWTRLRQVPKLNDTVISFPVGGRRLVLIDDVIFTGRTVRSALEAIFSLGRPASVDLAVLVDRGHRELPIQPDFTGLSLDTQRSESVNVFLHSEPNQDHVLLEPGKYRE
ncbi:MAG: bifunctional pyr operon transcriptional regulator/uracil phosphoribosyltransferase PyrR [Desulfarculaceae bacterium]|nr:bifunctional pyr operon transcriptional regulator/uracil phosphoribosyltransferase PyrR [Desulfarculaceae bacterium]MCF8046114.1 bifunctional pyr operon transcriptional regulator/uracil phosphoribosyltransferase PyrR [Desulfarculaceae bacterium]MCF8064983.1 bifunctional pyr operon transcriptional regulator/uracil phosphoribosyltransferase PyrR [Desulfarculaceae bacterium]MCF8123228.1 bifunctional pyr operon transcriptional regulator/uracil phosphoribosyltransferase PyrR [Desulfarculaceae bact